MQTVLITGATGFIGSHIVSAFLAGGWHVRATARDEEKACHLRRYFSSHGPALQTVQVSDMAEAGAYDEAVKGVDVIVHCASVVKLFSAKPYEDVYLPSVAGTLSILRSAMLSSTLKRFVFTSSTGAIYDFGLSGKPADHIYTEADWNDFAVKTIEEHKDAVFPVLAYLASKAKAEESLWHFLETNKPSFDAVSINPPFVFGPFFHHCAEVTALSDSVSMVLDIMVNKKELRPKAPFDDFIDVRDCARIHVWAATSSEASGKRFLASAGPFAEEQIQAIIAQRFPTSPAAIQVAAQVKSQASTYVTCADTKQLAAVYKEPFIALEQSIIDTATAIGKAFNQEQLVAMAETQ